MCLQYVYELKGVCVDLVARRSGGVATSEGGGREVSVEVGKGQDKKTIDRSRMAGRATHTIL